MNNFQFYLPTHIYFGEGEENNVGEYIKNRGYKNVLFHYGRNSIKKIGLYDRVVKSLEKSGIHFIELGGVEPNPEIKLVRQGVKICKENNIDFILAVGGGSVIDSAKSIAHGYYYDGDPFDFNLKLVNPSKSLPVGVILTISASGSEMSNSCVISDDERKMKKGFNSETNRPVFAILNPILTYSVSQIQTAYGIVDIISHTLERYFNQSSEIEFADYLAEGLLKSVIDAGKKVMLEPTNYDARATLMVASSYSHNGLTGLGKPFSFPIHQLEHEVSAMYRDIAHGAGLACLIPAWMKCMLRFEEEKLARFAINVLGVSKRLPKKEIAKRGIEVLQDFFHSLNLVTNLSTYGVSEEDIGEMVKRLPDPILAHIPLTRDLAREIFELAL